MSQPSLVPQDPVQSLIDAQNAAMADPQYAPAGGVTHCSEASLSIAVALGIPTSGVLCDAGGNNLLANAQIGNLANSMNGYQQVAPDDAQTLANQGVLVFATQSRDPHGHVVSVRPGNVPGDQPTGLTGPLLANVGIFVGVAHQSMVFTPLHGDILYYAPSAVTAPAPPSAQP
jgi:hypothetical protein